MIARYIQVFTLALLICSGLASCNKEIELEKVINVSLRGYNTSDAQFEVSVDTVVYDKNLLQANGRVGFSMVYPYFQGQKEATLRVKDPATGKELFKKTLNLSGDTLEFFYNLINIDGKLLDITPPPADPATNKLGFYIHYPESDNPIDILLYDLNYGEMTYLAKNVKPETWVYVDYLPAGAFLDRNQMSNYTVYFLKAGTTNDWAFNNDEYLSQASAFGLYLPHTTYNLNKVQSYFIVPSPQGWQADVVNLFPNPKQY